MRLLFLILILIIFVSPIQAQEGPSQAGIHAKLDLLAVDCGITPAVPGEWIAQTAGEVISLNDYLAVIHLACEIVAYRLWELNGSPVDMTPLEHFRDHFDVADLQIDRTTGQLGKFWGNTAPRHVNGEVAGYTIQLSHEGMADPTTFAHEIGHVVDGLLGDEPQRRHRIEVGGTVGKEGWIPAGGYRSNPYLFPRAVGGPNEDFAETFGQMMMGNLSPFRATGARWFFMKRHTRQWLAEIKALDEDRET